MDSYEATRIVFTKIQSLDPEYASKIMGLLLIQDHGEKELTRLAFGPEMLLRSAIIKARNDLGIISSPSSTPFANSSRIVNLPSPLSIPSSWSDERSMSYESKTIFKNPHCVLLGYIDQRNEP